MCFSQARQGPIPNTQAVPVLLIGKRALTFLLLGISKLADLRENAKSSVLIYYSIVNLVDHTRAAILCTQDSGGTSLLIFVFEYTIFFSTQHTDWP